MDTKFKAPAVATPLLLPNMTYSQHAVVAMNGYRSHTKRRQVKRGMISFVPCT